MWGGSVSSSTGMSLGRGETLSIFEKKDLIVELKMASFCAFF